MSDRECTCGHLESEHDLVQCNGRSHHDNNRFRCTCPGFTLKAPAEARDAALQRVEANADPEWLTRALKAVHATCLSCADFISDDVWKIGELDRTREDRALGAVMVKAAKNGWCRKTDRTRPSVRSNLAGKPVWESLIYREAVCLTK
jgi:hypothetical protein